MKKIYSKISGLLGFILFYTALVIVFTSAIYSQSTNVHMTPATITIVFSVFFFAGLLFLFISLILLMIQWLSTKPLHDAMHTLVTRYSNGDISKNEFDQMKKDIEINYTKH